MVPCSWHLVLEQAAAVTARCCHRKKSALVLREAELRAGSSGTAAGISLQCFIITFSLYVAHWAIRNAM